MVRNSICVPSMDHNLIPPFILGEVGLVLYDTLKIHCNVLSAEDHSLFDEETGLRIPFTLEGTLSVFKSRFLTNEEINNVEDFETVFISSFVRERDLNTENVPSRVNVILSPVSSSNGE